MATKTISIDVEAYKRLRSVRKDNESFSETIKRVVREPVDVEAWLKEIGRNPLGDDAADAVERVVAERRSPRNRSPKQGRAKGGR